MNCVESGEVAHLGSIGCSLGVHRSVSCRRGGWGGLVVVMVCWWFLGASVGMIELVWNTCVGRPEGRRRGEAAAPQQPRVGGHPAPGGAARLGEGVKREVRDRRPRVHMVDTVLGDTARCGQGTRWEGGGHARLDVGET